ncbi:MULTISPECIES: DUF6907 domain-containing protein [Streptomyces rochei group]|uniref:DUF6907 domain-containing protein n=1 Tax=Streptomyces rochei group TaxID=2867164 RepID=UPI001873A609|nr:hypothetical protein [Streptomyces vinaceusdrappus]GHC26934.1 hypothetical protein GCM10010308_49780 [Streptomyces vinaceusdrappus]
MPETRAINTAPPSGVCPPWCTAIDHLNDDGHQGPAIMLTVPGDETGFYDDGEPYALLWAALVRMTGQPTRVYLDALGDASGGGTHLDVAGLDAVLGDLRTYVDRLQQMRDRLAQLTEGDQ